MKKDRATKSFIKKLGRRIRELRKAQSISQDQLAYESGLRREAIGHIERGEQNPTTETLYQIAKALNAKVGDLFDFE